MYYMIMIVNNIEYINREYFLSIICGDIINIMMIL